MTGELAALITSVLGIMLTGVSILVLKDVEGNSTSKLGNVFHNAIIAMAVIVWGVLNIYTVLHGPVFLNDMPSNVLLQATITRFVCEVVIIVSAVKRNWKTTARVVGVFSIFTLANIMIQLI